MHFYGSDVVVNDERECLQRNKDCGEIIRKSPGKQLPKSSFFEGGRAPTKKITNMYREPRIISVRPQNLNRFHCEMSSPELNGAP